MTTFLDLAQSRRSIRKFTEKEIAVKDRETITRIETAVIQKKTEAILSVKRDELTEEYLTAKRKTVGFFAKEPLVIAAFLTKAKFFDPTLIAAFKAQGYDKTGIIRLYANYD
jgi:hypothetical protein